MLILAGSVLLYLILQMCAVWGLYRLLKNPSVVDMSWSLGLMMAGLLYLWLQVSTPRTVVVSVLLIAWSLRLAGYIGWTRIRRGHVDKRYVALSSAWKINHALGFFLNFQLQGLLIFIMTSCFYWAGRVTHPLSGWDGVAVVLILLGVAGETLADWQLHCFKQNKPGQVCDSGLWNYSRHPNYFFDWLSWVGFSLFGVQAEYGWLGLVAPLLLYLIFTRVTGPMTERGSLQAKGERYRHYQQITPMFFPRITKKIATHNTPPG